MIIAVSLLQGEALIDFLTDTGLVIVNGRKGKDAFTCVSSRGRSVVDYCVVPTDCMDNEGMHGQLTTSE